MSKIPLLSGKSIWEYTPEGFKEHVKSLHHVPQQRRTVTAKPEKKPFTAKVNKKGVLTIKVNREPKWISPDEFKALAKELGKKQSDLFLLLKDREIAIAEPAEMERVAQALEELPW